MFGQPLLRLTYNFLENDKKVIGFVGQKAAEIARSMKPTSMTDPGALGDYSIVPYQSHAQHGRRHHGHVAGNSAVNKYLQSWDVPNVFVVGASAFPHNSALQPDGAGRRARVLDGRCHQETLPSTTGVDDVMHRPDSWLVVVVAGIALALVASGAVSRAADPEKGRPSSSSARRAIRSASPATTTGPTLKGVMGRKAGSLEDYRYSAAMKRSDVTWDAVALDTYVTDPQAFIPGNRMAFAGIGDKTQRDDLIAYLAVATKN